MEDEQLLSGGNASGRVVRVGSTVRKPWTDASPSVVDFMTAVRRPGVGVPAVLGRDEYGRQITEYIPGQLALDSAPLTSLELRRVGSMVRAIHDASETFTPAFESSWDVVIPAPADELICHNDLAPWNLIVGERWAFIDWDGAGPSTRLWDLAYAAQAFTLSNSSQAPEEAALNLLAFVDGYRADQDVRAELPAVMLARAEAMHELLRSSHASGREPWGSMYVDGHGAHWQAVTMYVKRFQQLWLETLLSPQ